MEIIVYTELTRTIGLHARARIDRIAKDTVLRPLMPNDGGHYWAAIAANAPRDNAVGAGRMSLVRRPIVNRMERLDARLRRLVGDVQSE